MKLRPTALLLVVGILFFAYRYHSHFMSPQTAQAPAPEPSARVVAQETSTEIKVDPGAQDRIKWSASERELRLKRSALKVVDGHAPLKIEVLAKGHCMPGDLDAIVLDLKNAPHKKLRATLENVQERTVVATLDLGRELVGNRKTWEGRLPVTAKPVIYAVSLCTAQDSAPCSTKPLTDINTIFRDHMIDPKLIPPDRTFVFQPLLVDEAGIAAFATHPDESLFTLLASYLVDRGLASGQAGTLSAQLKEGTGKLGSLPVKLGDSVISILVPGSKAEDCSDK